MKASACLSLVALFIASQVSALAGPRIGLLVKDRDLFFAAVEKGATEAAKTAGAELIVKGPRKANSPGQQRAMLDSFLAEKLDALVIAPLVVEDCVKTIDELKAKGVKVVVIDSPPQEGLGNVCIDLDQGAMVIAAGKTFAGFFQQGEESAILRANSLEKFNFREKTFLKTVKEAHPSNVIFMDVMAGAVQGDDFAQSSILLDRHPGIKAVATLYTSGSIGMIRALKEKGLAGKVQHLGFGSGLPDEAFAALEKGHLNAWIAQQPRLLGRRGVEVAVKLLAGEKVPSMIYLEHLIVTPANLNDPAVQALRN